MSREPVLPESVLTDAIPPMAPVAVTFPRPKVDELPQAVGRELAPLAGALAGRRILITAGSRGVASISTILQAVVKTVRAAGGEPVVAAAMGSHGGGTPQGQLDLLEGLGITEESLGAPILASGSARRIGDSSSGRPLYTHPAALDADGILLVNRIKPHTSFRGDWESGLMKMLVVGLGLKEGASTFHGYGPAELPEVMADVGPALLERLPIMGGLAVIENGYKEVASLHGLPAAEIPEREKGLLKEAWRLMPVLPVDEVDVLIVEEMGKDISGTGMDTNVVGRLDILGLPEPQSPSVRRIVTLSLTPASHGNATGIGLADVVTQRLVDTIDPLPTYMNAFTSQILNRAKIPMTAQTDKEAIRIALSALPQDPSKPDEGPRVVRIRNTLALSRIWVSSALAPVIDRDPRMERVGPYEDLVFDRDEMLAAAPWPGD